MWLLSKEKRQKDLVVELQVPWAIAQLLLFVTFRREI